MKTSIPSIPRYEVYDVGDVSADALTYENDNRDYVPPSFDGHQHLSFDSLSKKMISTRSNAIEARSHALAELVTLDRAYVSSQEPVRGESRSI